ncbi:MAG: ribonuclease R [Patescibacteria group bacterium]
MNKKTSKNKQIEGLLSISGKGTGYLNLIDQDLKIEIPANNLNRALPQDKVLVSYKLKDNHKAIGKVEKILDRYTGPRPGRVIKVLNKNSYQITLDNSSYYTPILIKPDPDKKLNIADKVVIEIQDWPADSPLPLGKFLKHLGKVGENEAEILSMIIGRGLALDFHPSLLESIKNKKETWEQSITTEADQRRDFRNILTLTIDPDDAKDFDDALSIRRLENNKLEVGIHIADVSHYVLPESTIDKEARHRATSIYLVDRVIPMLPEVLSNDICSLRPQTDRLAFSVVVTFTVDGQLEDEWFGPTIIKSDSRLNYQEAEKIITTTDRPSTKDNLNTIESALAELNNLAQKLKKANQEAGAVSFSSDEVKFKLDKKGKPLDVIIKKQLQANELVENFMLLANKLVAEYAHRVTRHQEHTFVYRVHDYPDPEKIGQLISFLKPLGYNLKIQDDELEQTDLNHLLQQAENQAEHSLINRTAIRAMAKAVYSEKNIGHWGLAFPYYTHFTSPIRRYPDLLVHRLLKTYLQGKKPNQKELDQLSEILLHCSQREQLAAEAERESIKLKQAEYMQNFIDQTRIGIISGLTDWGIFVEDVQTKAEGLIRLSEIKKDYYQLSDNRYFVIGQRTGHKLSLGDQIKIKVINANPASRQIDFGLIID